ncbi:hypothetical protein [Lactiplantibacillus plajomi]|uniref:Uncharacterized protein n=1 Tax=Lactiplantibacillus plajomi TaxID=1457217 RepID=A0ABV6K1C1_9LACO|nr:hypothetical protein [Lactiplantibacillus plajomi]
MITVERVDQLFKDEVAAQPSDWHDFAIQTYAQWLVAAETSSDKRTQLSRQIEGIERLRNNSKK